MKISCLLVRRQDIFLYFCTMIKNNIPLKVALGYAAVAVVMALAVALVYSNTQSILNIDKASRDYTHKRNMADSLVYSLLDVSNNERSIYMETSGNWEELNHSISEAKVQALKLKALEKDSLQKARMDTLVSLLNLKQVNLKQLRRVLIANNHESFLHEKVSNLNSGKDSVVVHPKTAQTHENKRTTVEVVKTRKGFFRRLADAFKKGATDTIAIHNDVNQTTTDSISTPVDIAGEVAQVLSQIGQEDKQNTQKKEKAVNKEVSDLQKVSAQLAERTSHLLNTIRQSEMQSMQQALGKALNARRSLLWQITLMALLAMTAAVVLLCYIFKDTKKERIYRENLEEANTEIQRIMNQRERLLLTITHDIKAPVASISGFIDLMREHVSDEKGMNYIDNIASSASHLSRLVASLLDYHKLENGLLELHPSSFSPASLIQQCTEGMRMQAEKKNLVLSSSYQDKAAELQGLATDAAITYQADAFRIRQVLDNLISNAIKYTVKGKVTVTALVKPAPSAGICHLIIKIEDTGMGMTSEECRKVFQAFTRLKDAQGIEGTGLGLSITHELVTLLGGHISLQSEKGIGSTFAITLPIRQNPLSVQEASTGEAAEKQPASISSAGSELSSANQQPLANHKILILDDDRLQLQLLQEMLHRKAKADWQIFACQHVTEALTILHDEQPALMLMDIEMPEMNGTEIIRMINHSHMKVIAMTAHDISIKEELTEAGFDDCLFKPFRPEALESLLAPAAREAATEEPAAEEATAEEPAAHISARERLSSLLVFAGGDKEAEMEIVKTVTAEMETYREELDKYLPAAEKGKEAQAKLSQEDKQDVARIAHKLQPIAQMMQAECQQQLQALSPEHISEQEDKKIRAYIQAVFDDLGNMLGELRNILSE